MKIIDEIRTTLHVQKNNKTFRYAIDRHITEILRKNGIKIGDVLEIVIVGKLNRENIFKEKKDDEKKKR